MFSVTTSVHASPAPALIRVRGEIDLLAEHDLRDAASIVIDGGCRDAVLDLNDVSFLDCAGLKALLSCRERVEASGGRLLLGRTSPAVARILGLTRCGEGWATATAQGSPAACEPAGSTTSSSQPGLTAEPARIRRWTGQPRHPNCWTALREPAPPAVTRRVPSPGQPRTGVGGDGPPRRIP